MHVTYSATQQDSDVFQAGEELLPLIQDTFDWLQSGFETHEPKGIVFHDWRSAKELFTGGPLPVWTSQGVIHLDPLVRDWEEIFRSTIKPETDTNDPTGYFTSLNHLDIAAIAGGELTRHIAAFSDSFIDTRNDIQWFIEGFCSYLPRKRLLSPERFEALYLAEESLIYQHKKEWGAHPLWEYGAANRGKTAAEALYDRWRASSTLRHLVEEAAEGDVQLVLKAYLYWKTEARETMPLHRYLNLAFDCDIAGGQNQSEDDQGKGQS
ncbi:hypothetical protein [Salinithrix halophila]|uniref:Uncharacterized protein n=1 Tax=Salinithrix halophila TaxID=1485204 RepID=A0ABV8JAS7_9BACL